MNTLPDEKLESNQTERHEGKHGGSLRWLVWCALCLLIYILSAGPVARLAFRGAIPLQAYYVVYSPLQSAGEHWRPLERFMMWYEMEVWKARA